MFTLNPATLLFDFKFDVASALLNTEALNSSVARISETAQQAEKSIMNIGLHVLTAMGTVPSGMLGLIGAAVKATEKFDQSALSWANILSANKDKLSGPLNSHAERMMVSGEFLKNIAKQSTEFGLSQLELFHMAEAIAPPIFNEGFQGTNFENIITMSRQMLKSAPNLGITNPMDSTGQLLRSITGNTGGNDTLFTRLTNETPVMKDFRANASAWNKLDPEKRFKILGEALAYFAKDTDILTARMNSMTGQLQILTDQFMGFDSILMPFGYKIKAMIVEVLQFINASLKTDGRLIIENATKIFSLVAGDSTQAVVNLTQAQRMKGSLDIGKSAVGFIAHALLVGEALKWLGKMFGFNGGLLNVIGVALGSIKSMVGLAWRFIGPIFGIVARLAAPFVMPIVNILFAKIFLPILALMAMLTTIDRAVGYARVADIKDAPKIAAMVSNWTLRWVKASAALLQPFYQIMDRVAIAISPLFETLTWLKLIESPVDVLLTGLERLGDIMIMIGALVDVIGYKFNSNMFGVADKMSFMDRFNLYYDKSIADMNSRINRGDVTPKSTVHIGKVTIENKFKENMEPDRIAFTIKDQLLKLANNNTQAKGAPMYPSYGR